MEELAADTSPLPGASLQEPAVVAPEGSDRAYWIEQTSDGVWHRETLHRQGDDGVREASPLHEIKHRIRFALGSGVRGRSYLLQRGTQLFQSPVSWYGHQQRWDLAPGYAVQGHARYDRLMGESCLACHAGQMNTLAPGDNRYDEQQPFSEVAVGCERCHGPGKPHIEFHEQELAEAQDPIVNPAKLSPALRDSVCNQCHLQGDAVVRRYGREFGDFRPGDHLSDHQATFVHVDEHAWDTVAQVQQMKSSRCYQASEGRLGCISCHDAHYKPSPEDRDTFFNQRCQQCHDKDGATAICSLAPDKQAAEPAAGSCIACHMPRGKAFDIPHTAATDHRVPRVMPVAPPAKSNESGESDSSGGSEMIDIDDTTLFAANEVEMSERQRLRAKGLARMTQVRLTLDPEAARQAIRELSPYDTVPQTLDSLHDDYVALEALGLAYALSGREPIAEQCWRQVLKHRPDYDPVHRSLTQLYARREDYPKALFHLDRYLTRNDHDGAMHFLKAELLAVQGNLRAAAVAAERASHLDPLNQHRHQWLADIYQALEKPSASRRRREMVRLLQQNAAQP